MMIQAHFESKVPFGRLVSQEVDLRRLGTNETVKKMRWYVDENEDGRSRKEESR